MARPKNDGRGRLGGRQKGTPNKTSTEGRNFVCEILNGNKDKLKRELSKLHGESYVRCITNLMGYYVPKLQSISLDEQINQQTESQLNYLERLITENPSLAVEAIARKMLELQGITINEKDNGV